MSDTTQGRFRRVHPFWPVLLTAAVVGTLLTLLWITSAHGSIGVGKFLPWLQVRTYGPSGSLYAGWTLLAVGSGVLGLAAAVAACLISFARREPPA